MTGSKDLRFRFTAEGGLSKKARAAWHSQLLDRRVWALLAGLLVVIALGSIATGAWSSSGLLTGEKRLPLLSLSLPYGFAHSGRFRASCLTLLVLPAGRSPRLQWVSSSTAVSKISSLGSLRAEKAAFLATYSEQYGYKGWLDKNWQAEVGERLGDTLQHYLDFTGWTRVYKQRACEAVVVRRQAAAVLAATMICLCWAGCCLCSCFSAALVAWCCTCSPILEVIAQGLQTPGSSAVQPPERCQLTPSSTVSPTTAACSQR